MIIYYNFISIHNLGINAGKDEIDKVCKELENVKLEVENVKVEMKDFKYQVSRDMSKLNIALEKIEVLLKKNPDQYSCSGCSMGSFCLDGKPVGYIPLEKAMVRAKSDTASYNVYAGDTGIGYYRPNVTAMSYAVIWKRAGVQVHRDYSNMVYTCSANRE